MGLPRGTSAIFHYRPGKYWLKLGGDCFRVYCEKKTSRKFGGKDHGEIEARPDPGIIFREITTFNGSLKYV